MFIDEHREKFGVEPICRVSVYQQVLDMSEDAVDILERLLGTGLDAAGLLLSGREARTPRGATADASSPAATG